MVSPEQCYGLHSLLFYGHYLEKRATGNGDVGSEMLVAGVGGTPIPIYPMQKCKFQILRLI